MVKVFISWSGVQSKQLAMTLREWLREVIQAVDPWVSEEDIEKGKRWSAVLAEELEGTSQGILCLTRDNLESPWLNYEAGALAKNATESAVRTALFDLRPADITGPLAEFQHTSITDREDAYRLVQSINARCDRPLSDELLQKAFTRCWGDLEQDFGRIRGSVKKKSTPERSQDDVLREVLVRVRDIEKSIDHLKDMLPDPEESFPVGTRVKLGNQAAEVVALGEKYVLRTVDGAYKILDRSAKSAMQHWSPFDDFPVASKPKTSEPWSKSNDPWGEPGDGGSSGGLGEEPPF